ncbi:MAG: pyridoxal phosphate-dependent aminotransferase family protein [Nitrospirae bacterium]|nr:pyridoxal phosphate-dependent aminotransferase family protein [Nitrospirota bacterium]
MDSRLVQDPSVAMTGITDIFEKCFKFTTARELQKMGVYPFFRVIESAQDPEVVMNGRKMIMVGSNNYLGLTNHPKVKEAAIDAIRKYGSGCAGSRFLNGTLDIHVNIINLPEVLKITKKYGARLMVDDAHGIGVLGKTGRGTAEHFGLESEVDLVMGTYSKSLASIGGFIAGDNDVVHYIKHFARALIFSASPPPASVAAVSAALDIIENEPERIERLWKNTHKMLDGFKALGFQVGPSQTPIIPIIVGEDEAAFKIVMMLQEEGVFANVAVSPAVPPGKALIRTSYMATHTDEQLDKVLDAFKKVGKACGLI